MNESIIVNQAEELREVEEKVRVERGLQALTFRLADLNAYVNLLRGRIETLERRNKDLEQVWGLLEDAQSRLRALEAKG